MTTPPSTPTASRTETAASDPEPVEASAAASLHLLEEAGTAGRSALRHQVARRLLDGPGWVASRLVTDTVLLYAAVLAGHLLATSDGSRLSLLLPPLAVGLLAVRGGYRASLGARMLNRVGQIIASTALAAMALLAVGALTDPGAESFLIAVWALGTAFVAIGRVILGVAHWLALRNRWIGQPTLIVGAGRIGSKIERRLRAQRELGLVPVGYLDADPAPSGVVSSRRAPVLGAPEDLSPVADVTGARHVILAFSSSPDAVLAPLVRECQRRGIEVSLVPRLFDRVNGKVELERLGGLPLYGLRSTDTLGWPFTVKHVLGRAIAALVLIVLAPVIAATAFAVKVTSPGPVLFRQRRVGRDGHEFDLVKFRSMQVAREEGSRQPGDRPPLREAGDDLAPGGVEGNKQLTPIGGFIRSTSLDELPQLWNVVRGDMTLVGPRPERPEFVALFGRSIDRYEERHRVKSGITGWAQVHGLRGQTSLADRVEWDNYYIENWSLWLDMKILLMTLGIPFRRAE